jgi:hypothetical protein
MKVTRGVILGALTLALAGLAGATTYVVNGPSPHASDTNPGTATLPFKTIQHAADVAQAGDLVRIEPGTYAESIGIGHSGTPAKPIVFESTQWHGATVVPPDEHTGQLFGSKVAPDEHLYGNYVTVRGVVFGHTAPNTGMSVGLGRGWRYEDCVIAGNGGLCFGTSARYNCNDFTLLRTIMEDCYSNGLAGGGDETHPLDNCKLINCIMRRNNYMRDDPGGYSGANKFLFDTNLLFDGVISYDNFGSGSWFDTRAVHFTIRNSTFFANHAGYAIHDGQSVGDASGAAGGFWSEANIGPGLIENNVFYSNQGCGAADNDSGSKGAITIKNNWFVANSGDGLSIRGMADMNANYGNVDRRVGGNMIGNLTQIGEGGNYNSWASDGRTVSWAGGLPTPNAAHDHGYIWENAPAHNQGWSFTVPADTTTRTVSIYAGGYGAQSTLTAHISDGSAPDYTYTKTYPNGEMSLYTIAYHAANAGQKLTISYVKSGNFGDNKNGSIDLVAAWLSAGGDAAAGVTVTPAAAPYDLTALGTLDWVHWGRIGYAGDRLLGAAVITHNVFKDNGRAWGTCLEEHVLAKPADMGSVIDYNTYDIPADNHGAWVSWKPTEAENPVAASSLADMQRRLGIEAHGEVKHLAFRGPLIHTYNYPTNEQEAANPDPAKMRQVPSDAAEQKYTIDRTLDAQHATAGQVISLPVYGHTPIMRAGNTAVCQVYDLACRYVSLTLPSTAAEQALADTVTPYAIIEPTYLTVKLSKVSPYDIEATLVPTR